MRDSQSARGDPHDRVRLTVEPNGFPNQARVAPEPLAPQLLADHDNLGSVGPVVINGEHASTKRTDAEQREQVPGHPLYADLRRLVGQLKQRRRRRDRREPLELMYITGEIRVVRGREWSGIEVRSCSIDRDETFRFPERQWLQQCSADRTRDGGGRADAKGDTKDGGSGNQRSSPKRTDRGERLGNDG